MFAKLNLIYWYKTVILTGVEPLEGGETKVNKYVIISHK